jgi:hypothetical protein
LPERKSFSLKKKSEIKTKRFNPPGRTKKKTAFKTRASAQRA